MNDCASADIQFSNLYTRIDPETARLVHEIPLVLRWSAQRESTWDVNQKICFLDTAIRGWSCAPIYILTKEIDGVSSANVFDGAHKLESLVEFMKGDYEIKKISETWWQNSPLQPYIGKKFKDLPENIKEKIRKYKFHVNYINSDVANDKDALIVLWQRLNNAGTPLNGYELEIPVYGLLHNVLKELSSNWTKTLIFNKGESERGQLEEKLYQLLALSSPIKSFSSLPGLAKKWKETHGKDISEIEKKITENQPEYIKRLTLMRTILSTLEQYNTFKKLDGSDIEISNHRVPLIIMLGRMGYWFNDISQFNIHSQTISTKLKNDFFLKAGSDCEKMLNCTSRNAKFQGAIIKYIDAFLEPLAEKKRRLFNIDERKTVLESQGGKCALCSESVKLKDSEADHIIPFTIGGKTEVNNCQVLHKHCHRNKNIIQDV
jgi:hypothetical protein